MKNTYLISGAAALVALTGGVAIAQNAAAPKDRNAPVTRAEAQAKATEMFGRMDYNKDGVLNAADREARRAEMSAKRFAALDSDSNGAVTKAEWDASAAKRDEKRAERKDGDGPGKFKRGGRRGGGHGGHGGFGGRGGHGFADANKDGIVTKDEFVAGALGRFDAKDTDKNGTVTAEERKAAKAARRGSGRSWGAEPAPSE